MSLSLKEKERAGVTEHAWYALHEPLRAFLRKRVPDEETAEDLLQDVFLTIHTHAGTLRETDKLESWIYQIARHRLIDHYRRKKPVISLEEVDSERLVEDLPEEDVRAELAPSVAAMVNALPEPYREALLLTDYQGLSQRELANRLGLSFSGAKSHVQRAREKLRQMLLDCCHFQFDRLGRMMDYQPRCACCSAGASGTCSPHNETPKGGCCVLLEAAASLEVNTAHDCCS